MRVVRRGCVVWGLWSLLLRREEGVSVENRVGGFSEMNTYLMNLLRGPR